MQANSSFYGDDVFIIAEVGNNHEGDFTLAQDMVGLAAEAGVDAVKFQTIIPELLVNRSDEPRFSTLKKFQLSYDQFETLAKQAHGAGIKFLSTPFDLESAAFLGTIADGLKIASSDNTFYALIDAAARTGKPLIISTGLADEDDVRLAVQCVETAWRGRVPLEQLGLMHCVSNYPTTANNANIGAIASLKAEFPAQTIGYSDHTIGIEAARLAVGVSAKIIEKHFTIANDHSDFRDHQLSANPATMNQLVREIRMASELMGSGAIELSDCEVDMASAVRRSIVAAENLSAGTTITEKDLNWTRPAGGMAPGEERDIIGKRLKSALSQGDAFTPEILE